MIKKKKISMKQCICIFISTPFDVEDCDDGFHLKINFMHSTLNNYQRLQEFCVFLSIFIQCE